MATKFWVEIRGDLFYEVWTPGDEERPFPFGSDRGLTSDAYGRVRFLVLLPEDIGPLIDWIRALEKFLIGAVKWPDSYDVRTAYVYARERIGLPPYMTLFGTDENAFVRNIRACPGDLTPWLVYADWLRERGDDASTARAEIIAAWTAPAEPPARPPPGPKTRKKRKSK